MARFFWGNVLVPEALLACSVPDLQLDSFPILLDGANLEVDSNCRNVAFCVCSVSKPQEQATFAHTRVPNEKKLEKVVILCDACNVGHGSRLGKKKLVRKRKWKTDAPNYNEGFRKSDRK